MLLALFLITVFLLGSLLSKSLC